MDSIANGVMQKQVGTRRIRLLIIGQKNVVWKEPTDWVIGSCAY